MSEAVSTRFLVLSIAAFVPLVALYKLVKKNGENNVEKTKQVELVDQTEDVQSTKVENVEDESTLVETVLVELLEGEENIASWYGNRFLPVQGIEAAAEAAIKNLVKSRDVAVGSVKLYREFQDGETLWDREGGLNYPGYALERMSLSANGWSLVDGSIDINEKEKILVLFTLN